MCGSSNTPLAHYRLGTSARSVGLIRFGFFLRVGAGPNGEKRDAQRVARRSMLDGRMNTGWTASPTALLAIGVWSPIGRDMVSVSEGHDSSAEQFDAGAPVHLPSKRLQSIDVALNRPVAPPLADGPFHGAEIVAEFPHESLQGVNVGGVRPHHPSMQRRHLAVSQDRTEAAVPCGPRRRFVHVHPLADVGATARKRRCRANSCCTAPRRLHTR
jgi:hypothetical protein